MASGNDSRVRLLKDLRNLKKDKSLFGIVASPKGSDIYEWRAAICGPSGTPWELGTFELEMKFPKDYPMKPPKVRFLTEVFHPNVYSDGNICLDILSNNWSPIYDVVSILTSIQSLLTDPNPDSPANVEAAKLYKENRNEYNRKVKQTIESALLEEEGDSEYDDESFSDISSSDE